MSNRNGKKVDNPPKETTHPRSELQKLAKQSFNTKNSIRVEATAKNEVLHRALMNSGIIPGGIIETNIWFPNENLMNLVFSKLFNKLLRGFKESEFLDYKFWNAKFIDSFGVPLNPQHPEDWAEVIDHEYGINRLKQLAKRGYLSYFQRKDLPPWSEKQRYTILEGLIKYAIKNNDIEFMYKAIDTVSHPELMNILNEMAALVVGVRFSLEETMKWLKALRGLGLDMYDLAVYKAIDLDRIDVLDYIFQEVFEDEEYVMGEEYYEDMIVHALGSKNFNAIQRVWAEIVQSEEDPEGWEKDYLEEGLMKFIDTEPLPKILELIEMFSPKLSSIYYIVLDISEAYRYVELIKYLLDRIDDFDVDNLYLENIIDQVDKPNDSIELVDILLIEKGVQIYQNHVVQAAKRGRYELTIHLCKLILYQQSKI